MRAKKSSLILILALSLIAVLSSATMACTILGVGKAAMADGSTVVTHNDDSTVADFRLWIIPEANWPAGSMRDLVVDGHNYIAPDEKQPNVMGKDPQPAHTYRYLHSRYSFINEKGVSITESTMSTDTSTPLGKAIRADLETNSPGIVDCWLAQDIALERAATAREAVKCMGYLVEQYGWLGPGETMTVADGNEVWIAEYYGRDLWAAVRIPDNAFTVAANRARIGVIDTKDPNVLASPDIYSYAIDKGWYDPKSGKPFNLYEYYSPNNGAYSTRREWRALDLVAPSLKLDSHALRFPLYVIPEKKLSVKDVWNIAADYYQGTEYDLTKGPAAGPYGDPIRPANSGGGGAWERSINMHRTCYLNLAQIKGWLPDEIKGISWYGYGAPDTTYLVPLWAIMSKLPDFYSTGSRYETFRRDSGWWTNTYVQQMAEMHYNLAIQDIRNFRDPKEEAMFMTAPLVQDKAAELLKAGKKADAYNLIQQYAWNNAVSMQQDWLTLGDALLGKYAMGYVGFKNSNFPQWWNDLVGFKPVKP